MHWERPWCWERLKARGEGGDRGWDGWVASPIQMTWVWVNSGSWWWTGRPGMLWSIGSQSRTRLSDWTELSTLFELLRWLSGKESPCQCRRRRRSGFNPWVMKTPWRRKWHPLQYSYLENSMDRGTWWAIVHGHDLASNISPTHTPAQRLFCLSVLYIFCFLLECACHMSLKCMFCEVKSLSQK